MVTYLWDSASGYEMEPLPASGDVARGEELVASVGCMACHQLPDSQEPAADQDALRRQFGPNFAGIGSKTTPRWIYNWLRDPGELPRRHAHARHAPDRPRRRRTSPPTWSRSGTMRMGRPPA